MRSHSALIKFLKMILSRVSYRLYIPGKPKCRKFAEITLGLIVYSTTYGLARLC